MLLKQLKKIDGVELLLPVSQGNEHSIGRGACYGYTLYWADKLFHNQHPFGYRFEFAKPENQNIEPAKFERKISSSSKAKEKIFENSINH